mmetsp:Transcript_76840/g.248888  ORF Transcript_76840/g.248888 Transcript_76840/m.248888 type:complete len:250 (+) Transcript_76840:116-865(+)
MFPHSGEELRQQCRSHGEKTEVQAQARQRQRRSRGGRSGGASAAESCGRPPRWTEVLRVLKDGEGGDEDQEDDDFFGLGAIVEVGCMHGHTGSRRNWRLECKASGWQGKVRPDCRPTSCEAPDDMFGVWVFQQGFNDTLSLVCSDGYSSEGGSRVLFCNETPWARERLAGCVPGTGSARRFRSGLKAGALFGLLGRLTWHCHGRRGRRRNVLARAAAVVGGQERGRQPGSSGCPQPAVQPARGQRGLQG